MANNNIEDGLINYDEEIRQKEEHDPKVYNFYEAMGDVNQEDIKKEDFNIESEADSFYKNNDKDNEDFEKDLEKEFNEYAQKNIKEENKNEDDLLNLINNSFESEN